MLKCWHSSVFKKRHSVEDYTATLEYYKVASTFFQPLDDNPTFEQTVWSLYTEGTSLRKIADHMTGLGYRTNKDEINSIVNQLDAIVLASLND